MSLSALFTRRVRGVRLVNLWGAGFLLVLVVTLYLLKTFAGGERADIASTEQQISDEQRQIRLLHAELAYLEQPARIERLSERYLGLQPVAGRRDASLDELGRIAHGSETAPAPSDAAPAGSSAPAAAGAPPAGDAPAGDAP